MILNYDVNSYLLRHLLIQKQQEGQMRATQEYDNTFCNFLFCFDLSQKLNFFQLKNIPSTIIRRKISVIQ